MKLQGITAGGAIRQWVSITHDIGEYVFHLREVGKKEVKSFRDMIMRQVEKLREATAHAVSAVQKEVITKEVVMVPCQFCGALMPQTSIFCLNCGAKRK